MLAFLDRNDHLILFVALFGMLVVAALVESVVPRRGDGHRLAWRWSNNLGLWLLDQLNVSWFIAVAALCVNWWTGGQPGGLVALLGFGFWSSVLLAILAFELISYLFHRALHAVPLLWKIHMVHHADTEVDFTTTFRAHPLELLVVAPVTLLVMVLLGIPAAAMVSYQLLRQSITIFAHGNIRIPERIDRALRLLVVTPDFHRMHHCPERRYTDSNFSVAFPLYDYLFGTATRRPYGDHPDMLLGLEYCREPGDSRIDRMLMMPFRPLPRRAPMRGSVPPGTPVPRSPMTAGPA